MSEVARVACTPRVKRVQTISLSLIFIICVVNYMDRGALSVANPLIRNELGLSVAEMGVLLSAFLWPYAFTPLLAGAIVDRGKPRRVLTISLIVWSIAQGAAGFIASYGQFLVARALLGVGEAPMFPTAARVVNDWYHESDQALGVGIWNGAPPTRQCYCTGPAYPRHAGVRLALDVRYDGGARLHPRRRLVRGVSRFR